MRSVSDQVAAVLAAARPMAPLDVVLADAAGCVLAQDVTAEHDVPAQPVADHDGYAVRAADAPGWDARLPVVADAPPTATRTTLAPGTAVLVAAGVPLPLGADTVVPLGATDRGRAQVTLRGGVRAGEGVRPAGADARAHRLVIPEGTRLGSRHLALAAALGRSRLWVRPMPRVVVVTVGDELVEAGRPLRDGSVYDAVGHALVAAAREAGAAAVRVGPVVDDRAVLREVLADQLVRADVLVVAGGLGAGPWDTVPDVLAPFATVRIDQVAMAPGGRMGFGRVAAVDPGDAVPEPVDPGAPGVLVAALPGHPVAALTCFEVMLRPALRAMSDYADLFRPTVRASLTTSITSPAGRTHLVPATVVGSPEGGYTVTPLDDPAQPSLAALARANVLVALPEETTVAHAGDVVPCMVLES